MSFAKHHLHACNTTVLLAKSPSRLQHNHPVCNNTLLLSTRSCLQHRPPACNTILLLVTSPSCLQRRPPACNTTLLLAPFPSCSRYFSQDNWNILDTSAITCVLVAFIFRTLALGLNTNPNMPEPLITGSDNFVGDVSVLGGFQLACRAEKSRIRRSRVIPSRRRPSSPRRGPTPGADCRLRRML